MRETPAARSAEPAAGGAGGGIGGQAEFGAARFTHWRSRLGGSTGQKIRKLTISKMRGLKFQEGHHDFAVRFGGLVVYSRLVASSLKVSALRTGPREAASSGIAELDLLLGGGLHYGTSTLVMGPAGSGKSTVITQYALNLANQGERVVCYVFEETRENFLERAEGLGLSLAQHITQGTIVIEQLDPAEVSPGEFAHKVRDAVENQDCRVVVIDSLNGYLNSMPSESFLLLQMHELLVYLNERGVLTMFILVQHGFVGTGMHSPVDITYLADSVILLRFFEAFGEVRQAIAMIKKRTGEHERSIRQFHLTGRGIRIGQTLTEFEGVLTGVPVYKGKQEGLISGQGK